MTKERFMQTYVQENVAVHCPTEEQAKELLYFAHKCGLKWSSGAAYIEKNYWYNYRENSCYALYEGKYGSVQRYKEYGYKILGYDGIGRTSEGDII